MSDQEVERILSHYGKKGMKWGVRNDVKAGRAAARESAAKAGEIIRESRRAETPQARKAAADRYQKEVLEKFKTPEWKKSFKDANSVTRGEMITRTLISGPFGYILSRQMNNANNIEAGYQFEIDRGHEILREMRS